ncbi:response regulator [Labedaea rhizosphaerae]|uniref:response regulator n=1 Tax=Labedaea rhizosphaerae TaxID=598644 RepID=UPI001060E4A8|nr:response regulator transcription factor [Labedaea rhizosphaerae]
MIRVLLADDQRVVRDGLAMVLGLLDGIEVAGSAADGEQAVAMARRLRPDVVLMDLRMPRVNGIEATRQLAGEVHVIALTTYDDDQSVVEALRAGARGYLTKDAGADEIKAAIEAVMAGGAAIDPAVQRHVVDAIASGPPEPPTELPDGLTQREVEVLGLMADGMSNSEIAEHLVISMATVKSHVNHLLAKIGARDRAQAVAYAFRARLANRGARPGAWRAPS